MKHRQPDRAGREWTEATVREQALRLLQYRARSVAELRERLVRRGAPLETVAAVLAWLQEAGLVSDQAFATAWVESRRRASPRGARRIEAELRMKGIDRAIVEGALEGSGDEKLLALRAAEKRARALVQEPDEGFRRKLRGFLLRRGFDEDVVAAAVSQLAAERSSAAS